MLLAHEDLIDFEKCCQDDSDVIFSESIRLMKVIFHMKPMWDGRMKLYSNGPGHMTKMAAMSFGI